MASLGTDQLGRDVFSRLLYGARSTLGFAIPITLAVTAIGIVVGLARNDLPLNTRGFANLTAGQFASI